MVRGRGGQQTRGARGGQMGTRGGRITKNIGNPDFGFSSQTKNTYGSSPRNGGYNKNNSNNNYGGGQQQQPNYGGGQQQQPNYGTGQPQQNNSYNNQNQNKPRYQNPNNQNNNQNNRFSGNTPNNNHQGNNPSYNNNQNRGQNKGQGQNQNYNNSAQNRNNNPGYNKNQGNNNQGYNKPNQNYNNSGPQFNDNGNNSAYPQRNQNNQQGYSNNNPAFDNNFGQQSGGGNNYNAPKPSLLGTAPSAPAPVRNEPSSDDILKEIGKVFLTSMTGAGGNPQQGVNPMAMMNMMQGGPGGPPPNNNPSRYDNFYNDGNQFTNYNPPMFNNYRGGYGPRGGRGGPMMNTRGGMRPNNMRGGGRFNNQAIRSPGQNRRVQGPGAPPPGVKRPLFKSKNNPNFVKGKTGNLSQGNKTIKYTILQLHKSVEENNHPLVAFLRQVFYDVSNDNSNKAHFMMLSRILLKHQNVIKLLSYEVKKALDEKFGEGTEEEVLKKKQDFLKEKKTKIFNDYKAIFKGQENMDVKAKAIEEAFPILTGEAFTDENVPKPEDYVGNLETTEGDYINAFKMAFVKSCFEKFLYRTNNAAMPAKSTEKRLKFFLDNGFISHLLVDKVKLKTNAKLPPILAKYNKLITNPINTQKIETMTNSNYEAMKKTDEHLQTDIADYIARDKVSAQVLRDFADCIILFDKTATALKYKLIKYTPYINLSAEQKKTLFDELVHTVYGTAMNILKNNIKSSEKKFEEMEKEEVKEGEEKVKVEVDDDEEEEAV